MASLPTTKMKAVIFAGGVGTRMWPLSRTQTPKQFEKMVDSKSTLQLTVERIRPDFDWEDIYVSTGEKYLPLVKKQLPQIPSKNLIGEPEMRDVAPAVGYLSSIIAKNWPDSPMVILWSDHLMRHVAIFKKVLQVGGDYIRQHQDQILFLGQKARFPNQNLGWIQTGDKISEFAGFKISKFKSWHYQPSLHLARQFFHRADYAWNPGYFITTPRFILEQYRRFTPVMYQGISKLQESYGTTHHLTVLRDIYPKFEKISFDDAILEQLEPSKAVVIAVDFGWSDIGNWQVLKEALQKNIKDNLTKGKVYTYQCENSLIYNYTDQLVTTIDLNGMVVVNTGDVLLVCTRESIKGIKEVVSQFKQSKEFKKYV